MCSRGADGDEMIAYHDGPAYSAPMATKYDDDVISWANEQAAFLRAGNFAALDIEHIADEVEDVGKSEQRELESRMALLLAHLLKWTFQPERRGSSWETTIKVQRRGVALRMKRTPSLKRNLKDPEWWEDVWGDALLAAAKETGLELGTFPPACPWSADQIMNAGFLPG
jgi:Domain of unknown function DUF29